MNLSGINAKFVGTASFYAAPGVTSQFAYSLDGTTFTLIGSPATITTAPLGQSVDLSTVSALQNIPSGTTVYVRYYASGQTTTGGWGFYSADALTNGIEFTGVINTAAPSPTLTATSLPEFGDLCLNTTAGPNSFIASGVNLTSANISVGPLVGYTFSTTSGGTYTPSLSLSQTGGTYSQIVYVMFAPILAQSYSGNIPLSGGGATAINVPVTGQGFSTPPRLITGDSVSVNGNIEIAGGKITENGCTSITSYGIEYSGINGFANGSGIKVPSSNLTDSTFTSTLTGLVQNTAYYYKAYARNDGGIAYGAQKLFFTAPIAGGLTIYSTPLVRGNNVHYSLSGVKTGNYATRMFNMLGQVVFQRNIFIGVNFIDDNFILPGNLPPGLYNFQVCSPDFKINQAVLVH